MRCLGNPVSLADNLTPYLSETMDAYEVSTLANSACIDKPKVIAFGWCDSRAASKRSTEKFALQYAKAHTLRQSRDT